MWRSNAPPLFDASFARLRRSRGAGHGCRIEQSADRAFPATAFPATVETLSPGMDEVCTSRGLHMCRPPSCTGVISPGTPSANRNTLSRDR